MAKYSNTTSTQSHSSHTVCVACTKRIIKYKPSLKCYICSKNYHRQCIGFTPTDINLLQIINCYNEWMCHSCRCDTFPHVRESGSSGSITTNPIIKAKSNSRKNCATCLKLGNKLDTCDLCDQKSHRRCFAGNLGCKKCVRDIYPGD